MCFVVPTAVLWLKLQLPKQTTIELARLNDPACTDQVIAASLCKHFSLVSKFQTRTAALTLNF